jgi:hypothetical protein
MLCLRNKMSKSPISVDLISVAIRAGSSYRVCRAVLLFAVAGLAPGAAFYCTAGSRLRGMRQGLD